MAPLHFLICIAVLNKVKSDCPLKQAGNVESPPRTHKRQDKFMGETRTGTNRSRDKINRNETERKYVRKTMGVRKQDQFLPVRHLRVDKEGIRCRHQNQKNSGLSSFVAFWSVLQQSHTFMAKDDRLLVTQNATVQHFSIQN